jgi:hypothetical protein
MQLLNAAVEAAVACRFIPNCLLRLQHWQWCACLTASFAGTSPVRRQGNALEKRA